MLPQVEGPAINRMPSVSCLGPARGRRSIYVLPLRFDNALQGERMDEVEKPSLEEVVAYANQTISFHVRKLAWSLPLEQQEEIKQNAMVRVLEAFQRLDQDKKWKAYIQNHCKGAVLDYIRGGDGFEETGWAASDDSAVEPATGNRLRHRVEITKDEDGEPMGVDETAGLFGIFTEIEPSHFRPNWELLSRMSGVDQDVHLIAKLLLGFDQTEIAENYEKGITRERLSQKVDEFFAKLDAPEFIGNQWIEQTIFALGLCEYYRIPARDNGQGWNYPPFNLLDPNSFEQAREYYQPSLTGTRETRLRRSEIFGRYKVAPKGEDEGPPEEQIAFALDS